MYGFRHPTMSPASLALAALLAAAERPHESAATPAPVHFNFSVDWSAGGPATTLPLANFSIRKLEAFVCECARVWSVSANVHVHVDQ